MEEQIKTVENIYNKFRLLKKANCSEFVLLSELAKELKISKTELMEFIENNEKLFNTAPSPSSKGLCILNAYTSPIDNPSTDEWLNNMKKLYEKHVEVSEINDYGMILGYQIIEDVENNSKNREYLWRNTKEKLIHLYNLKIIISQPKFIGGYMQNQINIPCLLSHVDWQKELENIGWTFNIRK